MQCKVQAGIFIGLASLYTFFRHLLPNLYVETLVKTLPMIFLIYSLNKEFQFCNSCCLSGSKKSRGPIKKGAAYAKKVYWALIFSTIGDVFIVFAGPIYPMALFWGIVFFGMAHISYLMGFGMSPMTVEVYKMPLIVIGCTVTLASLIIRQQLLELGVIYVYTVPVYAAILMLMTWRSKVTSPKESSSASTCALLATCGCLSWRALGGAFFIFSDSVLSLTELTGILPCSARLSTLLVLSTYYASQFCFAKSAYSPTSPTVSRNVSKKSK